jgi:hypothetical protein
MGSQTVFGTLKAAYALNPLSLVTLGLVLLWALSPAGGQAALRSLSREVSRYETTIPISYMNLDPRVSVFFDMLPGLESSSNGASVPQALFGTALLSQASSLHHTNATPQQPDFESVVSGLGGTNAAIQASVRDAWGHARLPIMHLLPGFNDSAFNEGRWLEVPGDHVLSYSSGFGIPVLKLSGQDAGNASFITRSAYTRFEVRQSFNSLSADPLYCFDTCAHRCRQKSATRSG